MGVLTNVNEDAPFESGGDAILNVSGVSVAISCNRLELIGTV
jgi:hypothetical protein